MRALATLANADNSLHSPFGPVFDAQRRESARHLRTVRGLGSVSLVVAVPAAGLGPSLLWAFAPELSFVLVAVLLQLCWPLERRFVWRRRR